MDGSAAMAALLAIFLLFETFEVAGLIVHCTPSKAPIPKKVIHRPHNTISPQSRTAASFIYTVSSLADSLTLRYRPV